MPETQPTPLTAILAAADDAKRAHDRLCDLAETLLPAPQPPAVVLPTVDEVATVIARSDPRASTVSDIHIEMARAVLDLIADRVPAWVPVEPDAAMIADLRQYVTSATSDDELRDMIAAVRKAENARADQ